MDITRNWRLKTTRSQLLAARDPQTGAVILPQQTVQRAAVKVYTFSEAPALRAVETDCAQAAR